MDPSPSKRRRTSPSTSISVTEENTDLGSLPQNGGSSSKRRSSYMSPTSPTKASLARFHPSLLPQAKPTEPAATVTKGPVPIEQNPTSADGINGVVERITGPALEGLESGMNGVEKEQRPPATPKQRSQTPQRGHASAKPDDLVMDSCLRASPPAEFGDEGTEVSGTNGTEQGAVAAVADIGGTGVTVVPDSQNPQTSSTPTQHVPHVPTSGMGVGEDGEPGLPSTPSQLGLEPPPEKPNGLLFSSPSKRPRRTRRSIAKSSPLKPLDVPLDHSQQKQKDLTPSLGPRCYIANTPKPPPSPEEVRLLQKRSRLNDLEKQLQEIEDKVLRQLLLFSWQQDQMKEGKAIAKQNKDAVQRSAKIVQLRDEVLQIQNTQSLDHDQPRRGVTDQREASKKALVLTQRLASFLPFSIKPRPPEPRPPFPQNNDVNQVLDLDASEKKPEPRPHSPQNNDVNQVLDLDASEKNAESRPHSPKNNDVNQVLDLDASANTTEPFTITTSNAQLLPSATENSLLQQQEVKLSTTHQCLTCDLHLTADIATQEISHLDIQALSPWAEPELGSWLRQSHQKTELAALGKAFGRYWEAAKQRCRCWTTCTQDFSDLVANAPESNRPLCYLGMQDLVLAHRNVQLKVDWRISLRDDGEVESHSSAHPRFPPAWQQEGGGQLARIGDAFAMLVEERGIAEAVGSICKVVFPA